MSVHPRPTELHGSPRLSWVGVSAAFGGFLAGVGCCFALGISIAPAFASPKISATTAPATPPKPANRNLAALTQPLWIDLTPAQQQALAPLAGVWNTFSTAEKRSWIKSSANFSQLPADKQAQIQTRMREWAALSPEQRLRARANLNLALRAPAGQRLAEFEQYRGMTPEQRKVLRTHGKTSNTATVYDGRRTGLAAQAASPITPPTTSR